MLILGCRYYDGAPTELLGWRSEGAYPIILVLYP